MSLGHSQDPKRGLLFPRFPPEAWGEDVLSPGSAPSAGPGRLLLAPLGGQSRGLAAVLFSL